MKKTLLSLLLLILQAGVFAQSEVTARYKEFLETMNKQDYEKMISEFTYQALFEITPKEQLVEAIRSIYKNEFFTMQLEHYGDINISNEVEHEGIKYVLIKHKNRAKFHFNIDSFVQDSINEVKRIDSLRLEMDKDTAFQSFLKTYNSENDFGEEGNTIYDWPYHEVMEYDDTTNYKQTVKDRMEFTLSMFEIGMMMQFDKKKIKNLEISTDYENNTVSMNNIAEDGQIGIFDPKYGKWQFIANNTSQPMVINYLIPKEVRKKFKIKT